MDERSGRDSGRRTAAGSGLRATGATAPSEPQAGEEFNAGRGGAALDGAEARTELELRRSGAGGQSQPGVSDVHAHRDRNGARCQDLGTVGTSPGESNGGANSSAAGGYGSPTPSGGREENALGYDGDGSQHSLPHRQQSVGGWDAGADPDHETDQPTGGRAGDAIAGSAADDRIPGDGDCPAQPLQGPGTEREDGGEIPGVGAVDAAGAEPGAAVLRRDPQRSEASGKSEAAGGTAGDEAGVGCDDPAGQPSAATNHGTGVSGCHRHARQDRQRVRTHNRNHPQGQSEQADRIRQAGEDSGSRESDHYPLCGVPAAAGGFDLAAGSGAAPSATAGAGARAVGRRCRVLLGGE